MKGDGLLPGATGATRARPRPSVLIFMLLRRLLAPPFTNADPFLVHGHLLITNGMPTPHTHSAESTSTNRIKPLSPRAIRIVRSKLANLLPPYEFHYFIPSLLEILPQCTHHYRTTLKIFTSFHLRLRQDDITCRMPSFLLCFVGPADGEWSTTKEA